MTRTNKSFVLVGVASQARVRRAQAQAISTRRNEILAIGVGTTIGGDRPGITTIGGSLNQASGGEGVDPPGAGMVVRHGNVLRDVRRITGIVGIGTNVSNDARGGEEAISLTKLK